MNWGPGPRTQHLGTRVSALLDGQLSAADADCAWAHVAGCVECRDAVQREAWIKSIKEEYSKVRRGRSQMTAMVAKYRKASSQDGATVDADATDAAPDADLESRYPELAKLGADLRQHDDIGRRDGEQTGEAA